MWMITKIDLCPEEKQKIQPYPSNQQVSRSAGYLDFQLNLLQIVDSVMREDTLLGFEYRDILEIVGLSYDNQLWAYGLGLYRFRQSQRFAGTNLTRDEHVLRRMLSMGLYDDDDSMNNLGSRRAMMHSVVMADRLWEMIKVEQDQVELIVSVRKLEHRSHFSLIFSLWTLPLFLPLTTFPLRVLPNRLHSPFSLVFVVASSLT